MVTRIPHRPDIRPSVNGAKLKAIRKAQGLTVKDMAEMLCISEVRYYQIEAADGSRFNRLNFRLLVSLLEIEPAVILNPIEKRKGV